jgi:hypothetical protein
MAPMSQGRSDMRRAYFAAAVTGAVLVGAVIGFGLVPGGRAPEPTPEPTVAVASPSPTPATTAAATATPQPSPSPTARPAQAPAGLYANGEMGYALELKQPWHRSTCGSSISGGPAVGSNGTELFIPVPDADFVLGHVGPFGGNADSIHVFGSADPDGLSPREWRRRSAVGSSNEQLVDTTFAGRPALLVRVNDDETFVFANAGYMWEVGHRLRQGSTAFADRAAIVRSFRFLSTDEARAARAAATPSPAPRTAEQVADVLADGFARRDLTILARVIRPCFSDSVYQAGPNLMIAEKYLEKLRQRFAQGLVVEVRARPITDAGGTMRIRSTWRQPGEPVREADLFMTLHRGTTYWDGTVTCMVGPCPP